MICKEAQRIAIQQGSMPELRKVLALNFEEAKERLISERENFDYFQARAKVMKELLELINTDR